MVFSLIKLKRGSEEALSQRNQRGSTDENKMCEGGREFV